MSTFSLTFPGKNSWKVTHSLKRDAVWIFAKYRVYNGEWQHVRLSNNTVTGATFLSHGQATPDGVEGFYPAKPERQRHDEYFRRSS
ncbi:MAG: hypothetical protein R3B47_05780 [Bacteroidia bacterium]